MFNMHKLESAKDQNCVMLVHFWWRCITYVNCEPIIQPILV